MEKRIRRKYIGKISSLIGIIILLIFTVSSFRSYSQSIRLDHPNYSVHSPNVTNLGKYGDYPVDLSTGVPSINIPLYTINSGKLTLPLSLSYHASGIKIDQESSFVGLGWVLNSGGVVTRSIKDKIDEGPYGFWNIGKNLPDYNPIDHINGAVGKLGNNTTLSDLSYKDKEPDLFNIIGPGLTGEFCLNNAGKFVSMGLDSLQYNIDLMNNLMVIKDRQGNIFRFGRSLENSEAFERTSMTSYGNGGSYGYEEHISSWHLTEMISSDYADTISFKYKTQYYNEQRPINVTRYILNADLTTPPVNEKGEEITDMLTTIPNVQIIDKILFKGGSIEFTTMDDRIDISHPGITVPSKTRITGFTVYDKNRNVIRSVIFENGSYFNRTGSGKPIRGFNSTNEATKSLKLNAVKFLDKNRVFNNEYKFMYDETPLPPRNTISQDFWGYYNGSNNSSLIPETFYLNPRGNPSYYGDNRKTDFNYMKAGSLKKIIYPTGGSTVYEYEPNYYLDIRQSQNEVKKSASFGMAAVNKLSSCRPGFFPGVPPDNIVEFTPTENVVQYSAKLLVVFSDFLVSNGQSMTFKLTEDGAEIATFQRAPSSDHQVLVFNKDFSVKRGSVYKFEARTNGVTGSNVSICNSPYIDVSLTYDYWEITTENQITPQQAGGLRVKTITNFDGDDKITLRKSYEYGDKVYGPNNIGVGELLTDPSKNFYNYPLLYEYLSSASLKNYLWFSSDSQIELGSNHGCPVFYKKVTEKILSNEIGGSNGKMENYYFLDGMYYEPKSSSKYPYNFPIYPSWAFNLKKTIFYKQLGAEVYMPIKSTEYEYASPTEKRIKTLKIIDFEPDIWSGFANGGSMVYMMDNPKRYFYYNFYVPRGRAIKAKEIIKEYVNGIDSLTTEKSFSYNQYFDLSKESLVNSKSDLIENTYKYTGDMDYAGLKSNFVLSLPVESETTLNGKVKNGEILKYNDFGGVSEHYKFKNIVPVNSISYTSKDVVPNYYEKRAQLTYDQIRKNIQEVEEDGKKKCYLWSYNNQHIIAEIVNANYQSVETILTKPAIEQFSKQNPNKNAIDSFILPLRSALSGALITTYEYSSLVGLISQTDPKGQTTYYEYDGFQRLKNVKDQNGNILKNTTYNYKP